MVPPGQPLPGDADLVILPGTKATRADLAFLRAQGWDIDLPAHVRRGGRVLGLCGGFQMLGRRIADPLGIEGPPGDDPGLGLLDVETVMDPAKRVEPVRARHLATGEPVEGYEIHLGRTTGPDCARPVLDIAGAPDAIPTAPPPPTAASPAPTSTASSPPTASAAPSSPASALQPAPSPTPPRSTPPSTPWPPTSKPTSTSPPSSRSPPPAAGSGAAFLRQTSRA